MPKNPVSTSEQGLHDSTELSLQQLTLIVEIAEERIGIPAEVVVEVEPAAAITALPHAPRSIEGVLDLRGEPVAVINGRTLVGAETRGPRLSDRFVVIHTENHLVALRVDAAVGLVDVHSVDVDRAVSLVPEALRGVGLARLEDGLVVVHDPESFLSAEDSAGLEEALGALRSA